ncbi:hypothetical protein KIPB_010419, partial [Kipferlia bialata]|eukprot:g10419.t1
MVYMVTATVTEPDGLTERQVPALSVRGQAVRTFRLSASAVEKATAFNRERTDKQKGKRAGRQGGNRPGRRGYSKGDDKKGYKRREKGNN